MTMVIDRNARQKLATAIEDYLDERISNFDLDDEMVALNTTDTTVLEIRNEISRYLSDFTEHTYERMRLLPSFESGVRRWIMFLRSSRAWPLGVQKTSLMTRLLSVFQESETTAFSENPYWPLANEAEWDELSKDIGGQRGSTGDHPKGTQRDSQNIQE